MKKKLTELMGRAFTLFFVLGIFANHSFAQAQNTVSGIVKDSDGVPLPGANILEQGTSNGVQTDFDGAFTLELANANATLTVSYIGFVTKQIPVSGQTNIEIILESDSASLDEVVVVGYGTQRKKDVTGAISSVSGEDLNITREANPLNALAGKIAGLDVSIPGAQPGEAPQLLVRGRSSLNFSNEPLIVLDGIPIEGNLNDINSADIASIELLKDASSAAIYGARGANGVILITTKRGKVGKARFTFDSYYGFADLTENFDNQDAEAFVNLRREAVRSANEIREGVAPGTLPLPSAADVLDPLELEAYEAGVDTDFLDLALRSGKQVNHQLGINGGSEKVRYALSMSYFNQEGVFRLSDFERVTFRANLDINVTDKLKLGISQQANFSTTNLYNPLVNFQRQSPLTVPFNPDGTPTLDPLADGLVWNPLSNEVPGNFINERINYRYFANIFASYNFTDALKYTLNVQPQFEAITDNDFRASQSASRTGALSQAQKEQRINTAYTIENIVNYTKLFNEVHSFDATLLYSFQNTKRDFLEIEAQGPASDSQTFNNLGDASQVDVRDSNLETEGWTSYMARFNYGFKNRYLLTLTGRYDGSSKLSEGNKWGFFPSASLAWRIIEEPFMKKQQFFNDLKIRSGYGQVGRNPIDPYTTFGGLRRIENSFGNNQAIGFLPSVIANPNLSWERTTTLDIGLDFAFANNRISGSVDYYTGNTTDLLLNRVLPATSGFANVLENVGETENSGIEVVLNTVNIDSDDFSWTTSFNFSQNKNKIVKLLDSETDDIGNGWFIGQPLSVYYDRVFDGIWQLDELDEAASYNRRPGDIKLADLDGNGEINDDDRRILGQLDPKWIGGVTSRMQYKGFEFTVAAYTQQGHLTRSRALENVTLFGRFNDVNLDYWTPENPSNTIPRPNRNQERPLDNGVLSYVDGSFVRIRNITLGYDFNNEVASRIHLDKLRFYATIQNPFLFTSVDLDGYDAETGNGDDYLASPRTILFGINLAF